MMALLRTELRKCWSRRAVHLFGLLALGGIALAGVLVFINSGKPGNSFDVVDINNVFQGVSAPLTILGIALAASFTGAEWSAGTMTTLLTWEPRRGRVYVAKFVAAAIFTFVSAIALQAVLGLALLPSGLAHGSTAGVNAHWLGTAAASASRGRSWLCWAQGSAWRSLRWLGTRRLQSSSRSSTCSFSRTSLKASSRNGLAGCSRRTQASSSSDRSCERCR